MKWIATILLFYFSTLFTVPCSDITNECEERRTTSFQTHSHNQDSDDYCSPFCQCTCCSISINSFYSGFPDLTSPLKFFSRKKVLSGNLIFFSNYRGSIWQPPKINA
ncbi:MULTISPECIES: DUF6660 family protein [Olivibacter]|uniref:DUF6660 family protein n=1 Tax=Olivibacter oleidegradans TaxID=760123 RepID=A0ABV6HIK1_9SPHI